jgi:GNAT superfamily N-acetyltransferase
MDPWTVLLDALPFSLLPPELLAAFPVPGVTGFRTGEPTYEANMVGMARLTAATVDQAIDRVQGVFAGLPFTWMVGPLSQPGELTTHLRAHGLIPFQTLAGVVLDDLTAVPPAPSAWTVQEASLPAALRWAPQLAGSYGFGLSADGFRYLLTALTQSAAGPGHVFLAFPEAGGDPVGWGVLVPVTTEVALLSGSAVAPPYRGQGVYRALVAARLQAARASGFRAVLVTAVEDTSAPILGRLGFRRVCRLESWHGGFGGMTP